MKRFFKGNRNGQKGFTLVELLVVVGILGVLAAVAVPSYGKFFGSGKTEANKTELASVQSAMDSMMANKGITAITAQGTSTTTFVALPAGSSADPLSPGYLRTNPTKCGYTWDATGLVSQAAGC